MAKKTQKKTNYLVVWDVYGEDPVKGFSTLEEAKKFVEKELLKDEDVSKESIKVYKVAEEMSVRVSIEFDTVK